jgi:GTP-binding protein HflX
MSPRTGKGPRKPDDDEPEAGPSDREVRAADGTIDQEERPRRALLLGVQLPDATDEEFGESLDELERLGRTLGLLVVGRVTQKRQNLDPGAYLGPGKRKELVPLVKDSAIDLLLVDHEISPSQARNLEKETGAEVLDRTAVILDIFHRHARSRAARAQVEMVRLVYMAPRLREAGQKKGGDRQRGGIGGKGAGESHLELDRRKIRDRIAELKLEVARLEEEQKTRRSRRSELNRVALVGYTNAGKSTLMRALTGSDVYVADKLFATLDTTVRALTPESVPRILVSDTVGFIKKLPHGLVASFKSTLDEALEASLLLHVVDASSDGCLRQLEVTEAVLAEIGAGDVPRWTLFNKVDRLGERREQVIAELTARYPQALFLSARSADDVAALRQRIVLHFAGGLVEEELRLPYDRQELRGVIFAESQVLGERYDESAVVFSLRAAPGTLARLRGLIDTAPVGKGQRGGA